MQDRLEKLLIELEKGVEFGKEQAPIIVEQLLAYDLAMAWIGLMVGLTFVGAGIYLIKLARKVPCQLDRELLSTLHGAWTGTLATIFICYNLPTLVKIYLAPNLYVLDYLRGIL